ncbi:MAG TPA: hypothetical protein VKA66_23575 [Mycobacterium sp.]|nr:hypothetical protein [Mycobacterium sp.]
MVAGLIAGLLISGRFVLLAQDRAGAALAKPSASPRQDSAELPKVSSAPTGLDEREPAQNAARGSTKAATLQDALLRPYRFPFARPTPLEQVCTHLRQTLNAPVVLDLAALDRQNVDPQDAVQLDLEGVRLKTGLKLLLDQLGLTYRVVAEDNLMIITDSAGSEDSNDRIASELRALHRDLHALQDAVEELRDYLGDEGPRVRKPTIIEEMPDGGGGRPGKLPEKPGNARQKPEGAGSPAPGSRPAPSRVPLAGPRRGL